MVTLKDLADRAGVSVSVVSAVISGSKHVRMSAKTRERILDVIAETNYQPNYAARSLRKQRSDVLAVVLPRIGDPVYSAMLDGIYAAADEVGCAVLLGDAARVTSGSELLNRILGQGQVDGLLVRTAANLDDTLLHEFSRRTDPMILLDDVSDPDITSISLDEEAGIALAVSHLVELGHTNIAFLGGDPDYAGTHRRVHGFHASMMSAGLPTRDDWIVLCHQTPAMGYAAASEFLRRPELPTAIVVNNGTTASGVLAAAADAAIDVPSQLSIVAYHDVANSEFLRPGVTSVAMPMRELGREGVLAFRALRDSESYASRRLTDPAPLLVVRGSSAPPKTR